MTGTRADNKTVGEMNKKDLLSLINQALQQALSPVTSSIEGLKKEVEGLRLELKEKDAQINELSEKLDEREQYSRRNNLRIFGVQEENNESTDDIVMGIAQKLGVPLADFEIDRSHRVGKPVAGGKHRPIIVKFIGYGPRRKMFSAKKLLKGSKITIREDLTSQRMGLLNKSIEAYSLKNVWTQDGVIMINAGGARPSRARYMKDLEEILRRHPPAN